ncbi:MAG: hypothetical protein ACKPKT_23100 [Dolichospermum sp.]
MKFPLISAFTIFSLLGLCQSAKAYNPEACVKDPMTSKPETINLLKPVDQKMLNCIPKLDSIASKWQSQANSISSAINRVQIGNQGENEIEKLEYNLLSNTIFLVAKVRAKHTWKVTTSEVRKKVPVDKYRWVKVPYPDVRMEEKCIGRGRFKVCKDVPVPFTNYRKEKVPYVEMEERIITPGEVVFQSASTTCKYDYTYNISTTEQKPVFNCGQGSLGNYKLDASAITNILNGQTPSLSSLVTSFSYTPPLIKDENRDTYHDTKNNIIANHPNSIVYFSSESFVNWASVENSVLGITASIFTGGGYSQELIRQMTEKLRTEVTFMTVFASQTAINLGAEEIVKMMTEKSTQNLGGYNVSVKAVSTPIMIRKCIVNTIANTSDCMPEIPSPRLGFAVIASKENAPY